jgi:hypothetical protein
VRDVPDSFSALKKTVEALIKDERKVQEPPQNVLVSTERDYVINYIDKDDELINVSDDEDLLTAYEVAELELEGNLKFVIEMKKAMQPLIDKHSHKIEKKVTKDKEKKEKKAKKLAKKKKAKIAEKEEIKQGLEAGATSFQEQAMDTSDDMAKHYTVVSDVQEGIQNMDLNGEVEDEDMELADSDEEVPKHGHKRCHRGEKKTGALPPRKAIKKLIYRELDNLAPQIFE